MQSSTKGYVSCYFWLLQSLALLEKPISQVEHPEELTLLSVNGTRIQ